MLKFAANLSMLFTELDFLDRFAAAAKAGFSAVEFLFPYDYQALEIKTRLEQYDLSLALFNAPPGDWHNAERGIACLPGREQEFLQGIELALEYALALGNKRIHVMAGILPNNLGKTEAENCYVDNLRQAALLAQPLGINLLIEPINNIDMPGYLLNHQEQAITFIQKINQPNLRLQFDCYHCQIMQGNVVETFKRMQCYIDHIQIAGVPGRQEPDVGELNYAYILQEIAKTQYAGFVGCEYMPLSGTEAGINWRDKISL